jgi:hypothetical protein
MIITRVIPQKDGFSLLSVSARLALMYYVLKRPGKGGRKDRIQCAYFGFDDEQQADKFAAYVKQHCKTHAVSREAQRLIECSFEVKVSEFDGLMQLVEQCAAKAQEVSYAAA